MGELRLYCGDIGLNPTIAWEEMMQHLEFTILPVTRTVSWKALINTEYSEVGADRKENNIKTEKAYGTWNRTTPRHLQIFTDIDDILGL